MINPCSEEVSEVDMRLKLLPTGEHTTITNDNVNIRIKTSIAYRITNPICTYYVLRDQKTPALR